MWSALPSPHVISDRLAYGSIPSDGSFPLGARMPLIFRGAKDWSPASNS